jgi:hypothetical protein
MSYKSILTAIAFDENHRILHIAKEHKHKKHPVDQLLSRITDHKNIYKVLMYRADADGKQLSVRIPKDSYQRLVDAGIKKIAYLH